MPRRVVVTGMGIVCAIGNSCPEVWNNVLAGKSGIGKISLFDAEKFSCRIAGEVKNFDPLDFVEKKDLKKMARFICLAIAAADEAIKMAGLSIAQENAGRVGVHIGSGVGGFDVIEREHQNLINGGPRRISPFFIPAAIVNLASGYVSIRYGAKGPNKATCTACTSSTHALGDAYKIIQRNEADVMIAGGSEAAITPMAVGGFAAMRALSTRNDEPEKASRPWDSQRDGFVLGEGSAILVIEELDHAIRRNAPVLAEITGYGMSADAYHITQPSEDGDGGHRVMLNALRDANLCPEKIGYINAHGTSTVIGDVLETKAIKKAFGAGTKVAVSSTKAMTGHVLGAAGAIEAVITIMALINQVLPATINLEIPGEDCDLDYVPREARKASINFALSNSFGFGGTNGSLIFRRWQDQAPGHGGLISAQ